VSNKRKLKKPPRHVCDDGEHVMHMHCSDPDCTETDGDIRMCDKGWNDFLAQMQMETTFDCPVCGGSEALGLRIGREWLNEPRFIWRCDNECAVTEIRSGLLARGIDADCLGDYGTDDVIYELDCCPREPDSDQPTALYRWWDEENLLLYVGISDELAARVKGHVRGSSWMDFAATSAIERHPTRTAALAAEEEAIKAEKPIFNKQHNSSPEAQQRLVEYLIKHNRLDLLAPAVSRG
jgi:predicted GIY-YIG superfamily endonuclease